MKTHSRHLRLARACDAWNRHTCPSIPRTDWAHECHNRAARKLSRFIRDNYGAAEWRELSNGAIHPAHAAA